MPSMSCICVCVCVYVCVLRVGVSLVGGQTNREQDGLGILVTKKWVGSLSWLSRNESD